MRFLTTLACLVALARSCRERETTVVATTVEPDCKPINFVRDPPIDQADPMDFKISTNGSATEFICNTPADGKFDGAKILYEFARYLNGQYQGTYWNYIGEDGPLATTNPSVKTTCNKTLNGFVIDNENNSPFQFVLKTLRCDASRDLFHHGMIVDQMVREKNRGYNCKPLKKLTFPETDLDITTEATIQISNGTYVFGNCTINTPGYGTPIIMEGAEYYDHGIWSSSSLSMTGKSYYSLTSCVRWNDTDVFGTHNVLTGDAVVYTVVGCNAFKN